MRMNMHVVVRFVPLLATGAVLAGCVGGPPPEAYREPEIVPITATQSALKDLPPPAAKIPVAVYDFPDQTGQFKPQENVQTLSRAVSQGGAALLIKALRDAGRGQWFTTLERNGLDALLKERQIIADMRLRYLGERQVNPQALPPLLFAGILLQGGIVGFDTNTLTGGLGARFLGIGGDVQYRQNTVTVNLRAISVKTGEVLSNVTTSKTIASIGVNGGAFKFVSFDKLLEVEAGITNNEPGVMALRRTIEKAVYAMIMEGSESGLWSFRNAAAGQALLAKYNAEERGVEPLPSDEAFAEGKQKARPVAARAPVAEPASERAAEPIAILETEARPAAMTRPAREASPRRTARPVIVASASAEPVEEEIDDAAFRWDGPRPVFEEKRAQPKRTVRKASPRKAAKPKTVAKAPATVKEAAKAEPRKAAPPTKAASLAPPEPSAGAAVIAPRFSMRRNQGAGVDEATGAGLAGPSVETAEPSRPTGSLTTPRWDAPPAKFDPPVQPADDEFTEGRLGA
ncbi:MAG: CsgG/HfaB family protein [Pseudomonadota bacterium]